MDEFAEKVQTSTHPPLGILRRNFFCKYAVNLRKFAMEISLPLQKIAQQKNLRHIFFIGNDPSPFGLFLEIYLFWRVTDSLNCANSASKAELG